MGKTLTTEEFIQKAILKHGDKYDYSEVEYINSKTYVQLIHKKCGHKFKQLPSNHLQGHGCPQCSIIKNAKKCTIYTYEICLEEAKKYNTRKEWRGKSDGTYQKAYKEGWLEECTKHMKILGNNFKRCIYAYEFENVNGLNYVYVGLSGDTKNRDKKHKIKGSLFKFCQKHKVDLPQPIQLSDYINEIEASKLEGLILEQYIKDEWIPINKAKTGGLGGGSSLKQRSNNFFKKAYEIHGDEYDYSEVEYVDNSNKIWLTHKSCGYKFEQRPDVHLNGSGCPECGKKRSIQNRKGKKHKKNVNKNINNRGIYKES